MAIYLPFFNKLKPFLTISFDTKRASVFKIALVEIRIITRRKQKCLFTFKQKGL